MRWTKNYADSPAKAFDAVEDVKTYLGDRYDQVRGVLSATADPYQFASVCENMLGIEGYPIEAFYDSIFGQGKFAERHPLALLEACERAYAQGLADGRDKRVHMNLFVHEAYTRGVAAAKEQHP